MAGIRKSSKTDRKIQEKNMSHIKHTSVLFNALVLTFMLSLAAFAGIGGVDQSFNPSAYGKNNGSIVEMVEQPDGKILIGGFFMESNGKENTGITRINPDGTVDQTFDPPEIYGGFGIGGLVQAIALQSDGKILIGGSIYGINGAFHPGVYRLHPDGSLDTSFTVAPMCASSGTAVRDIEVLPDDSFVIGGDFILNIMGSCGNFGRLAKFTANGTMIGNAVTGLGPVNDIELLPGGNMYIAHDSNVRRFLPTLESDPAFPQVTASHLITNIETLPNGQFLIVGNFTQVNGFTAGRISRISSDGSVDLTFNQNNTGASGVINDVSVGTDGKILIGGSFAQFNGQERKKLILLNSDGTLDANFQSEETSNLRIFYAVLISSGSKFLAGLDAGIEVLDQRSSLIEFNPDGTINEDFDTKITRYGRVTQIEQQPDEKIYVSGSFMYLNGFETRGIGRLNNDGSVDETFVSHFNQIETIPNVTSFAVQPDGKIIVGWETAQRGVYRLNTDGSLDKSFTVLTNELAYDLVLLPDGKILVAGNNVRLRRLNSNGTVDNTFSPPQPNDRINKIELQPDGKILVGGRFTQIGATLRGRIARYNSDGTFDNSFNPAGGANGIVHEIRVQSDGKVLLGGEFTALNGSNAQARIGRLTDDGTLDNSFTASADGTVFAIDVQADGRVLIGGVMSMVNGVQRKGMARLSSGGALDTSFFAETPLGITDISLPSGDEILIGGEFLTVNGQPHVRAARLINAAVNNGVDFDFDGDGRSDIGVFRASSNIWYQLLGVNYNFAQTDFGLSGDIVAPADYDGDGRTDLAIFRPSAGDWWYQSSQNGGQVQTHWGQSGDVPRPADFDGDGKDDFIVYRPSETNWYRFGSSGASDITQFGSDGDIPLGGDYDGDGKGDLAIFRPATGDWWYRSSLDGLNKAVHWGISTDLPAPGDYDGDGRTDFAVYRPSTGVWYIYNSGSGSATIVPFGIAEDIPVPADYDGDGSVDIAVYRPSTGVWYLLRSTEGFAALQFGIDTDIPIPSAFNQ
jgi:uncharacterized delta-60 repeat protein